MNTLISWRTTALIMQDRLLKYTTYFYQEKDNKTVGIYDSELYFGTVKEKYRNGIGDWYCSYDAVFCF